MLSKLFLSTAALTGAVLVGSMAPGFALGCPFRDRISPTDTVTSSDPAGLIDSSANFNRPDLNKLGIAGGTLAALLGLYAGGLFLQARRQRHELDQVSPTVGGEEPKALPLFPIEVPTEALAQPTEDKAAHAETLTR